MITEEVTIEEVIRGLEHAASEIGYDKPVKVAKLENVVRLGIKQVAYSHDPRFPEKSVAIVVVDKLCE